MMESTDTRALLSVSDLAVSFEVGGASLQVVHSASLEVRRGEMVALVGESGSGKTVTSLAITGLVGHLGGRVVSGTRRFDGHNMDSLDDAGWRRLRGNRIGMVFQQPMRSLNPALTVGEQIAETIRAHRPLGRAEAWKEAVQLLDRVQIANASDRARLYPHQMSGGMCQRVMIAMAISCAPDLIIADEPTTALDVTVQAKILNLLRELVADSGASLLYISHDLAVVSELCSRLYVMYAGETVEAGSIDEVLRRPLHPYTSALLQCAPSIDRRPVRLSTIPGVVPRPGAMPQGCRFHPRCSFAETECEIAGTILEAPTPGRRVRCVRHDELELVGS